MPLTSYCVEKYRAFAIPTTVELRPLTLLFGYNSAGKSALLRVLPLLAGSTTTGFVGPINLDSPTLGGAAFDDVKSRYDKQSVLHFALSWPGELGTLRFTIRDVPDRHVQVVEEIELTESDGPGFTATWAIPDEETPISPERGSYVLRSELDTLTVSIRFQGLVPMSVKAVNGAMPPRLKDQFGALREQLLALPTGVHWLGSSRQSPSRRKEYTGRRNRIEHHGGGAEEVLAYDRLDDGPILPTVSAWYEHATGHRLDIQEDARGASGSFALTLSPVDAPLAAPLQIRDTGEGMAQVLPVLVLGAMAKHGALGESSVVAIEHPALHLHPAAEEQLAAFFAEICTSPARPRFILETHSEHFLLQAQLEILHGRLSPEDVVVYWVRQERGSASMERIVFDELGQPQGAWPPEVFSEHLEQARKIVYARRQKRAQR